jgi:hypothetical protein
MDIIIHQSADGSRIDGEDVNAIFNGVQRQGFIKADEGVLLTT